MAFNWTVGDVSGSETLTDNDHIYASHVNELREQTGKAFLVVGTEPPANYVCDGTADETEINAAITALNSIGGGIVFLKPGNYTIASSILNLDGVEIWGAGFGTLINLADGADAHGFYADGVSNIGLKYLRFDGNSANQTTDVFFNYFKNVTNCVIEGCYITDCRSDGIHIREGGGNHLVKGNWCYSNGENGICVIQTDGVIIDGNFCWSNGTGLAGGWNSGAPGILLRDDIDLLDNITLVNNSCYSNTQAGITVLALTNSIVSNNQCYLNVTDGMNFLSASGVTKTTISYNNIHNNGYDGLVVIAGVNVNIIGNIVMNNAQSAVPSFTDGIQLRPTCYQMIISGNVCSDDQLVKTQGYGISFVVGAYDDIEIIGNQLKGNATGTIYSAGSVLTNVNLNHNAS